MQFHSGCMSSSIEVLQMSQSRCPSAIHNSLALFQVGRGSQDAHCQTKSILRVLVGISQDSVDDLFIEPGPVLPCSCEPKKYGDNDHEGEDWKGVVEVVSRDWKMLRKAEDHHHPSGVNQREDIDRDAECSQRPAGSWYTFHQPSTEHTAYGDGIRRKQRQRCQGDERTRRCIAANVEKSQTHDHYNGYPDRSDGDPVSAADVREPSWKTSITSPRPSQFGSRRNIA